MAYVAEHARQHQGVMHVRISHVYCTLEEMLDPSLRGQSFVVGTGMGHPHEPGCIIDASSAAVRLGVTPGMPLQHVQRIVPQVHVVPASYDRYPPLLQRLKEHYHAYSRLIESLPLADAFLDLSGCDIPFETPVSFAQRLCAEIAEMGLTALIGIANGKATAELAALMSRQDGRQGVLYIPPGLEASFVQTLPLSRLLSLHSAGMGTLSTMRHRSEQRETPISRVAEVEGRSGQSASIVVAELVAHFYNIGITNFAQVAALTEENMLRRFGHTGGWVYRIACGQVRSPVVPDVPPLRQNARVRFHHAADAEQRSGIVRRPLEHRLQGKSLALLLSQRLRLPSASRSQVPKKQFLGIPHTKLPHPPRKRKRGRRWVVGMVMVITILAMVFTQANGQGGALAADTLRALLGPTATAQIESWYLGLSDTAHRLQYQASGQQVKAPWTVRATPRPSLPSQGASSTPTPHTAPPAFTPMTLASLHPLVTPALAGEGVWSIQQMSLPTTHIASQPLSAKAFLRPDPIRPYAVVTLLAFDTRLMLLHIVAGTYEPGGPRGVPGPGVIPVADQKGNALLAAFNGGFKYADGQYGLQVHGTVYVPPQPNAATLAITKEGQIIMGAWGADPRLNSGNTDLAAWRQNASLLINHGVINPLTQDGAAWGGTILNRTFTWRSGIGITAQGMLLYAAGDSLSAFTLGQALHAAGAVTAMQTDINPLWVRAFLYDQTQTGNYSITKLNPSMQGTGFEYLNGAARDFFYVTRTVPVLPSPSPRVNGGTGG